MESLKSSMELGAMTVGPHWTETVLCLRKKSRYILNSRGQGANFSTSFHTRGHSNILTRRFSLDDFEMENRVNPMDFSHSPQINPYQPSTASTGIVASSLRFRVVAVLSSPCPDDHGYQLFHNGKPSYRRFGPGIRRSRASSRYSPLWSRNHPRRSL